MIYLVGLFAGIINGFFAGGAGNILIFYLIFIKKIESHIGRAISIAVLSITSIYSVYGISKVINFEIKKIILLVIISGIGGIIGSKIMNKINSVILNLISGIVITLLSIYGLCR